MDPPLWAFGPAFLRSRIPSAHSLPPKQSRTKENNRGRIAGHAVEVTHVEFCCRLWFMSFSSPCLTNPTSALHAALCWLLLESGMPEIPFLHNLICMSPEALVWTQAGGRQELSHRHRRGAANHSATVLHRVQDRAEEEGLDRKTVVKDFYVGGSEDQGVAILDQSGFSVPFRNGPFLFPLPVSALHLQFLASADDTGHLHSSNSRLASPLQQPLNLWDAHIP